MNHLEKCEKFIQYNNNYTDFIQQYKTHVNSYKNDNQLYNRILLMYLLDNFVLFSYENRVNTLYYLFILGIYFIIDNNNNNSNYDRFILNLFTKLNEYYQHLSNSEIEHITKLCVKKLSHKKINQLLFPIHIKSVIE